MRTFVFYPESSIKGYSLSMTGHRKTFEPPHDKTNKMMCAPSKDSDQPGHPPSLIIFTVLSLGS